jgi:hypothetical protein
MTPPLRRKGMRRWRSSVVAETKFRRAAGYRGVHRY